MTREANEPFRTVRPKEDLSEATTNLVKVWSELAAASADIAHSKRALFLAYVAEGFTEAQAIDLVKTF